jgi:hypothetical protein
MYTDLSFRSNHLPDGLSFETDTIPSDELSLMLKTRVTELRERVYRPFLYLAIHHPPGGDFQASLAPFVAKSIEACITVAQALCIKHRHHGAWYSTQQMLAVGLLLLGAVKSQRVHVPERWRDTMEMIIAVLQYWEDEAPDVKEARRILQDIMDRVVVGDVGGGDIYDNENDHVE